MDKAMNKGILVVSLDFELLWGIFDKVNPQSKKEYFQNTREVIPKILELFRKYEISCTWATVGMLFNRNWKEWQENFPEVLPAYKNKDLNPYVFGEAIKDKELSDLCFAKELIKLISNTPGQEVATHTYSHYYCSEEGQTPEAFRSDLLNAIKIAESFNINTRSLVFPRNQLNETYLEICGDLGIKTVRSNPEVWYWKETEDSSLLKRIFRTGDAYFGRNNKSYPLSDLHKKNKLPLSQRASRLLRPRSKSGILNKIRLNRIKSEMSAAAVKQEVYHLWWHPHNFGNYPQESLSELESLLNHFRHLSDKYEFTSCNMAEIEDMIEKNSIHEKTQSI